MIKLDKSYSDYTDETDVKYPAGKGVNASSSESYDGTPWLADMMNDEHGARQAIYKAAYGSVDGLSGVPDNADQSDTLNAIKKLIDDPDKAHADLRGTSAHGATVEASPGQLVTRDENGCAKFAAPINDNDAARKEDLDNLKKDLLLLTHPIGSLYWSSENTNPSTLFGGTWVQIKDKFILAAGDTYTKGSTGGAATVVLTIQNLPSHTHSFTPSGSVSSHSHTIGHTHSFTTSSEGGHDHRILVYTGNTRKSIDNIYASNTDSSYANDYMMLVLNSAQRAYDVSDDKFTSNSLYADSAGYARYANWGAKQNSSYKRQMVESSGVHSHTGKTENSSAQNSGAVAPTFTGTAGTTGAAGSGTAIDKMPPYVVKYCWERTA